MGTPCAAAGRLTALEVWLRRLSRSQIALSDLKTGSCARKVPRQREDDSGHYIVAVCRPLSVNQFVKQYTLDLAMGSMRSQLTAVVAISVVIAWLLGQSVEGSTLRFLSYPYGLQSAAVLAMLGGVHAAPRWAWYLADFVGVLASNLGVWLLLRWIVGGVRARSNPTVEIDARKDDARGSP